MADETAKRQRFRALLKREELLVMPGGFSPLYARVAEAAGFESFFLAGSQMSGFLLGVPDTGILGLRDVVDHARHCAAATSLPILLDADTGFGNAVNVHWTVRECVRSGVAGLQLEDQEAPKKSGTAAGRRCIPLAEAAGKIRAAIAARDAEDPAFVICARCDSLGAESSGFEETLERCRAYAEAGADLVWANSVRTREQMAALAAATSAPLLVIWGGGDPVPTFAEYAAAGVKVALFPTIAASAGLQAAWTLLHDFRHREVAALTEWRQRIAAGPYGAADFRKLTDYPLVRVVEERFLPAERRRDYDSTWGHAPALAAGPGAADAPKGDA
jgi:2-methylisocitrate lyase-like PEP mutase family enzyme